MLHDIDILCKSVAVKIVTSCNITLKEGWKKILATRKRICKSNIAALISLRGPCGPQETAKLHNDYRISNRKNAINFNQNRKTDRDSTWGSRCCSILVTVCLWCIAVKVAVMRYCKTHGVPDFILNPAGYRLQDFFLYKFGCVVACVTCVKVGPAFSTVADLVLYRRYRVSAVQASGVAVFSILRCAGFCVRKMSKRPLGSDCSWPVGAAFLIIKETKDPEPFNAINFVFQSHLIFKISWTRLRDSRLRRSLIGPLGWIPKSDSCSSDSPAEAILLLHNCSHHEIVRSSPNVLTMSSASGTTPFSHCVIKQIITVCGDCGIFNFFRAVMRYFWFFLCGNVVLTAPQGPPQKGSKPNIYKSRQKTENQLKKQKTT